MNPSVITIRIPGQNRSIETPSFLTRLMVSLNHHKLLTQSATVDDNNVSIVFADYEKFMKFIKNIREKSNADTYELIKDYTSITVTLPDQDSTQLIATWKFPKSKVNALDNAIFKLFRK